MRKVFLLLYVTIACTPKGHELITDTRASAMEESSEFLTADAGICQATDCFDGDAKLVFKNAANYDLRIKNKSLIDLHLEEADFSEVTKIFLHSNAQMYFISYELTNQVQTVSKVKAIAKSTGDVLWTVTLRGGHLSTPLKREDHMYVATNDLVAKIDFRTGSLDWRQPTPKSVRELEDTALIELKDNIVEFQTHEITFRVDSETGKLL